MEPPLIAKSEMHLFEEFYQKYNKLAAYQLFQIVKDPHVMADLLQGTFVRLIPKIDLLQSLSENQLRVYISQTAKHTALDYMRKKHVRDKWTYYPEETSPEPADNADTPEGSLFEAGAPRGNTMCYGQAVRARPGSPVF